MEIIQASKPKSNTKLIVGVVIAAVLSLVGLIAAFIYMIFSFTQPLVVVAESYFDTVKSGEVEKSYQDFFSVEAQKRIPYNVYLVSTKEVPAWAHKQDLFFNTRRISGNTATLIGTLKTDYGAIVPLEVTLVKENGSWKIFELFFHKN